MECEKEPKAKCCACDPPCGALCVLPGCNNPATTVVDGDRVFARDVVMLTDEGVAGDPDTWEAWVCKGCSKKVLEENWKPV